MKIKINPKFKSQLKNIGLIAEKNGVRAYLVGGPVRDLLCGKQLFDLDIAIEGNVAKFINELSSNLKAKVVSYKRFGTFVLTLPDNSHIDFATARREIYAKPGALPDVRFCNIEADLLRRDFSINAIAISINSTNFGEIIDPFSGALAVRKKAIEVLHTLSFRDDPTRIFRLARFASRGFSVKKSTLILAKKYSIFIKNISPQRIKNELISLLEEKNPGYAFNLLSNIGAISKFSVDVAVIKDFNFLNRGKDANERLYLLINAIGLQKGEKFLRGLCFSKKEIANFLTPLKKTKILPVLNGEDLKKLNIKPGPLYKQIFSALLKRKIKTKKAALEFVKANFCR